MCYISVSIFRPEKSSSLLVLLPIYFGKNRNEQIENSEQNRENMSGLGSSLRPERGLQEKQRRIYS